MIRLVAVKVLLALLGGCAGDPRSVAVTPTGSAAGERTVDFLLATNRAGHPDQPSGFGANRSASLSYAHYTVTVPPRHKPGRVEMPRSVPDPGQSFTVARREDLERSAFHDRIAQGQGRHDVFVYVHGYNTSFPRALYHHAQIVADARQPGTAVLFSWPSQGVLTDYTGDRDAANFSRDHLAILLTDLARDRRIGRITVLGHSMGGWLTTETLRQLALTGRQDVLRRLRVVLAAPDIDVDVFATQVAAIGPMEPPLTVLVATDDTALRVSGLLSGGRARVGELDVDDPRVQAMARRYGIALVNIADFNDPGVAHHSRYAILAALDPEVEDYGGVGIRHVGAFTLRKLGGAIASPFVLVAAAIAPR